MPTTRAVWLAVASLLPATLAMLVPAVAWVLISFDLALLALVVIDFVLAPRASVLTVRRVVEPVLSSGRPHVVTLEVDTSTPVRGVLRDWVPGEVKALQLEQPFSVSSHARLSWQLTPVVRGDLPIGPVTVRLLGPLGLCARQQVIPLSDTVKVYPDLSVLNRDALALARASEDSARVVRIRSEGREFESLREYRVGDDPRTLDWKATARRGRPFVRQYQPERNQQLLLMIDCGRHMAGGTEGRRKVDHAVDAALRLARVAIDQGDLVGVMAFGAEVQQWLPPRKGAEQLKAITHALYRVEATLEEAQFGKAIDAAFARATRRTLVVLFTDLLDRDAAAALTVRARRLVPRHLVMIVSLQDPAMRAVSTAIPIDLTMATERLVAQRLERESEETVARLREGGAQVVRGTPQTFGVEGVRAYLSVKQRGLL